MTDWPKVSVIIPFYSNLLWLEEAIESVLLQNYINIEIIVVNDGSAEDLSRLAKKYDGRIMLLKQENGGPAAARNAGIDAATGKYIALLDSDDIWLEGKLFRQVAEMEKADAVWGHHSFEMFWENSSKRRVVDTACYQGDVLEYCYVSFKTMTACIMIRRDMLVRHSIRYPEEMRYGEDIAFYASLAQRWPLAHTDGVYAGLRMRGSNAALNPKIQLLNRVDIWKRLKANDAMRKRLSKTVILAHRLSYAASRVIVPLPEGKATDFLAGVLYVVPYLLFKISSRGLKRRKCGVK